MTTVQHPQSTSSYLSETYDPDDVGLRDSPLLQPIRPNLSPSSSPEPMVPLPEVSPECSPEPSGRKGSNRPKNRPSLGDAVLVHFMDGGKHLDISRKAGDEPLASDNEDGEDSVTGGVDVEIRTERESSTGKSSVVSVVAEALERQKSNTNNDSNATQAEKGTEEHLEELAQSAMRQIARNPSQAESRPNGDSGEPLMNINGEAMEDVRPSIPEIHVGVARGISNTVVKTETPLSTTEELPPIRQHSPQSALSNSNNAGQITLPSLSAQLGDINKIPDAPTPRDTTTFSQSPPALPPRFSAISGHGSPPKSPNDFRALPSPGRGGFGFYNSQHRRPSQSEGHPYSTPGDYSSSTETPSTDNSASTPAMGIDRMSIDNMTNPQIGGFQCTYPNCIASPFQTQYLLNSHANVHSQNRPHYCNVKGCPRSEGGKGFKRKNEMIRHGLVHDSPGYVCPFCPDREHKYPRPDNLQRHVRVHHVDKDKDDPLLRDVLAQRPEGPSRGRRRRGGTS